MAQFGKINKWLNLVGIQSARRKLVKIKVQGVYWPLVQSLRGVLAFFPNYFNKISKIEMVSQVFFFFFFYSILNIILKSGLELPDLK